MMLKKRFGPVLVGFAFGMSLFARQAADAQPAPTKARARVTLASAVDAVVPGQPFDVGIHFQIDKDWHTYWGKRGYAGQAPAVNWTLPDGFTVGELQFPIPERHVFRGVVTTNILEGDPILLARVTPPGTIGEGQVTILAKVAYEVCNTGPKAECVKESAGSRLELPVRPEGEANPAHVDLFDRARLALPKAGSEYLTVTPSAKVTEVTPESTFFDLLLTIDIAEGHSILAYGPDASTGVFLRQPLELMFNEPEYPKPHRRTDRGLGEVGEFTDRFAVRVPGELDKERPAAPVRITGVFTYEAYTVDGDRIPPEAVAFSFMLTGEDGSVLAVAGGGGPGKGSWTGDAALPGFLGGLGLVGLLVGCFVYGLFLNATPCVLPLLSIKVLGFVQQAHESRRRTALLGLVFGVGVMLFFVLLGFLAAAGENVLQYPAAVIGLSAVVMSLALSMLGVYTLQAPTAATKLEASLQREGLLSSFGKGALAPVLGFACTGPLLFGAWGWATQQEPHIAVFAFLFAGLGMASPYMLLGANPNWLGFLPKPGPWMVTFERIMGFLLLAMVIWLLNPLVVQIGVSGFQWTLVFLVAVAMGCWVLGKVDVAMPVPLRWRYRGGAITIVVGAGALIYGWITPLAEAGKSFEPPWRSWSAEAVESAVRSGQTVFVDVTSASCTVCKGNKLLAVNTKEVYDKIAALGVVSFQADFTSGDPVIAAALRKYGRAGPPLNLIYPAGKPDDPIVLRPNLTKAYLLNKFEEAGPSRAVPTG